MSPSPLAAPSRLQFLKEYISDSKAEVERRIVKTRLFSKRVFYKLNLARGISFNIVFPQSYYSPSLFS